MPTNFPLWDIMAKRESKIYAVSVKTRNKYTNKGKLNRYYDLFKKSWQLPSLSKMKRYMGFEFLWLALQVDVKKKTYSAYYGELEKVHDPSGNKKKVSICMSKEATQKYDRLVSDQHDCEIVPEMSNENEKTAM